MFFFDDKRKFVGTPDVTDISQARICEKDDIGHELYD